MPTEKLKAVVAGTGWGQVHVQGYAESEHADLIAVWSRSDKPSARAVAGKYGVKLYHDFTKMLDEVRPDVVSVSTPEVIHAPLTIEALNHGCHVYCEKVLSDSAAVARDMVAAAAANKRQLNVGYNYRYSPSCLYLTDVVKQGRLGTLLFAHLRAFTWCVHHMTDFATSLLGQPKRTAAAIELEPLPDKPHKSDASQHYGTFIYAAFTKKTYMVEYEGGAMLMAGATDYSAIEEPGATFSIVGSDGRAELDDLTGKVTVWSGSREATVFTPSQIVDAIGLRNNGVAAIKDFARAMAEGEPAPIPGEAGGEMIVLEEAILRGGETGKWEPVAGC